MTTMPPDIIDWGIYNGAISFPLAVVLFDGAGLSARGLRMAGFRTIGVESNPACHRMAKSILDAEIREFGNDCPAYHSRVWLCDVRDDCVNAVMANADVIWASPPCQLHSSARTQGNPTGQYAEDLLPWSLELPVRFPKAKAVWIENVTRMGKGKNDWGTVYNACQFGTLQNRNRVIAGRYLEPVVLFPYRKTFRGVCPTITASEIKGCASDKRRASKFYGRRLTLHECAYHMDMPEWMLLAMCGEKTSEIYKAIGNGVPLRMAKAFGDAAIKLC